MEKIYIKPSTKVITLNSEALMTVSGTDTTETELGGENAMTNKQDQSGSNSLWDSWSN